ncbi:PREDICTED: probable LRR receptor-like serine/threonine-protein kinase At3g47570 [Ipomoea nil]|uniref:probable LRR receptor-like serine/threonine-protein kinase At3g47570 n=1 Tax=Ipomoea nil TaxID=35883 RepID=UPI0009011BD9|nr:PREDICTED: probable LRR receptor-like serine/threonine-protein kinase At3g47570 [Ipomoea nil]
MSSSSLLVLRAISYVFFTFLLCNTSLSELGNYTDYQALLSLRASIAKDPLQFTASWNESIHFCEWVGITCGRKHKRVTKVDFHSSKLQGPLSPSVGNLSFLTELVLYNNSFRGTIPNEIGKLRRLQVLDLTNNSFSGEIPKTISLCFNLVNLGLSRNNLTGKFPLEFQSMLKLQYLDVSENNLVGEIPAYIANFTSLHSLSFSDNNFVGEVPTSFGKLVKLSYLSLGFNNLSGTLPTSIFNLSSLKSLVLSENRIRGYLPSSIGSTLPNLEYFNIYSNLFIGPLPNSMSNITKLRELDVAYNGFTGRVPTFSQLKQLQYFGLSSNPLGDGKSTDLDFTFSLLNSSATLRSLLFHSCNFGGVFPKYIANFTRLMGLTMYGNLIYGNIPNEIHLLGDLELLDLTRNQLNGTIPTTIGRLPKLYVLEIGENKFSGEIPTSLGNLSMLSILYLSSNNLLGSIPSSLGKSMFLSILGLSKNNLTGHLPKELFPPTSSLVKVDLSYNCISGPFPSEIGGLKILVLLDLSNNRLSGTLPSSLGTISGLIDLNISFNFFNGVIPHSFSSLKSLQNLDLSSNNFTGKIPKFFGELQYLEQLNLSFNHLEGEIPSKGIFKNWTEVEVNGNNLCGGIPQFGLPTCPREGERQHLSHSQKLAILFSSGTLILLIIVALIVLIYKQKNKQPLTLDATTEFMPKLSYWDIQKATNEFSKSNIIGFGKFSTVYKGILDGSLGIVAIKVFKLQVRGASKSFLAECEALRQIKHRNLVKILTACCSIDHEGNDFLAIVYEYMINGSLDNWLHNHSKDTGENKDSMILNLLQRVNIAIDVVNALDYLHNHLETCLVHCDLKPSNILLDGDLVVHVADFGLAKFLPTEVTSNQASSSTGIKGTFGYAAPEYGMGSDLSTFGDMYSYGILLLEIFTNKSPTSDICNNGLTLHNYVRMSMPEKVTEIVDPKLFHNKAYATPKSLVLQNHIIECLVSIFKIGIACSMELPRDRMSIGNAVKELHSIKDTLVELGDIGTIPR